MSPGMPICRPKSSLRFRTRHIRTTPKLPRFVREASSLVKLSHPHIVKIVDFGEQGGQPYAVMQFLSGGSLATRQGDEGQPPQKLPAESLKDWLPSIAKASISRTRKVTCTGM